MRPCHRRKYDSTDHRITKLTPKNGYCRPRQYPFFISAFSHFDPNTANIGANEHKRQIFTEQTAGNAIPIFLAQFLLRIIGTDDGGLLPRQPNVDDIIDSMYINNAQKQLLKLKVNEYLASRDCNSLEVINHDNYRDYTFVFSRENEYVRTVDEFDYDAKYVNLTRVFRECYQSHYHDKLEANPEFRKMIEKTGLEFLGCHGGYVTDYNTADDRFKMTGDISVTVSFRAGSKKRIYDLDLDRMELSRDYREWDL